MLGCGSVGGIGSAPELFGVAGESEAEAHALMDAGWALGIDSFDTAASYGGGRSELAIGRWLSTRGHRVTVTTKAFWSVTGDPTDRGLAPDRLARELRASLDRLGLARVDMYMAHEPDPDTPLADTLRAFDAFVGDGLVGAYGLSNVDGRYLEEALGICAREGLRRPEWVQNSYSLLDRSAEREILPLCAAEGLGFTAFSPLAGGWLTGKYRRGEPYPEGSRMTLRPEPYGPFEDARVFAAIGALAERAAARDVSTAALALAWLLGEPRLTALVIGPRRPAHLEPAAQALGVRLTPEERDELAALFA